MKSSKKMTTTQFAFVTCLIMCLQALKALIKVILQLLTWQPINLSVTIFPFHFTGKFVLIYLDCKLCNKVLFFTIGSLLAIDRQGKYLNELFVGRLWDTVVTAQYRWQKLQPQEILTSKIILSFFNLDCCTATFWSLQRCLIGSKPVL